MTERQEASVDISRDTTVDFVVRKLLCTSCGTCAGVCANRAIEMRLERHGIFVPVIDGKSCTRCGLCLRVCPGYGFDYSRNCRRLHGGFPEHAALGSHIESYAGYTTDQEVLHRSQSGGFVSALLLFCMRTSLIDGAVVTRWRPDSPLTPETYIARDREQVLAAAGSKYNPIPASQMVGAMLREPGRFAFVGTSCQIQGMRKAEEVFPKLADKVALYIGLHCLGTFTFHFHDQILHKVGLSRSQLTYFRQRDKAVGGWPCGMRIQDGGGRTHDMDARNSRLWPRPYFTNWRCMLCFDKANEFSDVSCGDCRSPREHKRFREEGYDLGKGLSEFVVRTERARTPIARAIEEGLFVVHRTDADSVARSIGVAGKKLGLNVFLTVARIFRAGVPDYGIRFARPRSEVSLGDKLLRPWAVLSSCRYYVLFVMSRFAVVRWILKRVSHRALGVVSDKLDMGVDWVRHGNVPNLVALFDLDGEKPPHR